MIPKKIPTIQELLYQESTTPNVMQQAFRPWLEVLDEHKEKEDTEKFVNEAYSEFIRHWMTRKGKP